MSVIKKRMYGYFMKIYEYMHGWYTYLFCKDIEPFDAREIEFEKEDFQKLHTIIDYYKGKRPSKAKLR